jgi:excisionase family DNA binding protein
MVYTLEEVATALKISSESVGLMIKTGRLRAVRVGIGRGTWRIPINDFNAFLAGASNDLAA